MYTLPNMQRQLYPKVPGSCFIPKSLERTNPHGLVWLFKPQSITNKGLIKSYIGGDLQSISLLSLTLYYVHGSSYVGAPTHKCCPASINMLQVPTFKGKKEP
jgi:hypothetical protein